MVRPSLSSLFGPFTRVSIGAICASNLAGMGCGGEAAIARTELLLVADTNVREVDAIVFEVSGKGRAPETARGAVRSDGAPLTLGILNESGSLGPVIAIARGYAGSRVVVTRSAVVSFVHGKTLVVPLHLLASCVDVLCPMEQTCGEEGCVPSTLGGDALTAWSGTAPNLDYLPQATSHDAGTDAGAPSDAGSAMDAGSRDAGSVDAGSRMDGSVDAGESADAATDGGPVDAATDSGAMDAATDAGPADAATDAGPADAATDDAATDSGAMDAATDAGPADAATDDAATDSGAADAATDSGLADAGTLCGASGVVDVQTNPQHCGRCYNACASPYIWSSNSMAACLSGACAITCQPLLGNCDYNWILNGCETSLASNNTHCGACGHACNTATQNCSAAGVCVLK